MTPEERAGRAIAIKALLDDPTVKEAFASIEADIIAEWKKTFDPCERDNLWQALNVMGRLQTWMISGASGDLTALKRVK